MREEYEQMELDTRTALDTAIEAVAKDSIQTVLEMIQKHHQQVAREAQTAPPFVRNRHEAYGIAAEQLVKISMAVKAIKNDIDKLLGTLSDPNFNAVDATSSIVNSATAAAQILINAAAEMRRTLDNLYTAEMTTEDITSPLEAALAGEEFQEAEPADSIEETETEDH